METTQSHQPDESDGKKLEEVISPRKKIIMDLTKTSAYPMHEFKLNEGDEVNIIQQLRFCPKI